MKRQNMNMNPICILSSERSGSNLLRKLISNHSTVSGPQAPHLLEVFSDLWIFYKNGKEGYHDLIEDMIRLVNHDYYGWGLSVSSGALIEEQAPNSFLDCFASVYDCYRQKDDNDRIVFKENNLFDYAWPLLDYFEEISFVYLYRDPRDCAASWMKVPMGYSNPLEAARAWSREQQTCVQLRDTYEFDLISVSYEELVEKPELMMRDVLTHAGLEVENACFSTSGSAKAPDSEASSDKASNEYHKNLNKPIMSSNKKKYRKQLDLQVIRQIETVAREEMIHLGYRLDTEADWEPSKRGTLDRVRSVATQSWNHLSKQVSKIVPGEEKRENNKTKTEKMVSSMLDLRREIAARRKHEWKNRQ